MKLRGASGFSIGFFHGCKDGFVRAGHQNVLARIFSAQHGPNDFSDLLRSFPFAENNFGESLPECAVVIYLGKTKILKGEMLQALECAFWSELARFHGFQKFQQFRLIHILRPAEILSLDESITLA